jgi:ankyrin repeat protein
MDELTESAVFHKKLWEQYTPLMKAVANGITGAVEPLCRKRRLSMSLATAAKPPSADKDPVNMNIVNHQGGWNKSTALILAAQFNRIEITKLLLGFGADMHLHNDVGDNALMVAASRGHIEIVKLLVEASPTDYIFEQNFEMNTAAHFAAMHGHLEIVVWLFERDEEDYLITFDNNEGKNVLHIAAESGHPGIVQWLVEYELADVNKATDKSGETPLMLACKGPTEEHEMIVEFLLRNQADATLRTRNMESALMYATKGTIRTLEMVYSCTVRPNSANKVGLTAFMLALRSGNEPMLDKLIELGAKKVIVKQEDRKSMAKLAWMITTEHIVFSWLPKQDIFALRATEVFTEEELAGLTQQYVNMSMMTSSKPLMKLVHSAARVDFHFDLFIRMIPHFKTPSTVLNKTLPLFYRNLFDAQEDQLINRLVKLASAIHFTIRRHPLEKNDLYEFFGVIERMVGACLAANSLDEERNVQRVLCCSVRWWDPHFKDDMVEKAQAFEVGPLHNSLENKVKIIFRTGHVSRYVSALFYNVFKKTKYHSSRPKSLRSEAIHYRYCPAAVFFGEGVSKAIFLVLIAYMSILVRNKSSRTSSFEPSDSIFTWAYRGEDDSVGRLVEIFLLIMSLTKLIYEYGQMCSDCTTIIPSLQNFVDHFENIWDTLDVLNLILVGFWVVVNHFTALERYAEDGRAALAASTIFLSLRVLQYFSVFEPIGKLLIMLVAMMKELTNFIVVYGAIVVGFSICLFTLLPDAPAYASMGDTLLILFGATLANYEEDLSTMVDNQFYEISVIIQVAFIFFTAVILLNLIIARMSATHNRIDDTSYQEWQFSQAKYCQEYLLLEERNPFCMLPSPLNIIPALSFPIHALYLQIALYKTRPSRSNTYNKVETEKEKKIEHHDHYIHDKQVILSIAGTVSDVCMGIVMAFLAPQYELIKQALEPDEKNEDEEQQLTIGMVLFYSFRLLLTPVIYIFTVGALITDACKQSTHIYVDDSGDRRRYKINYEQREHYMNPGTVNKEEDHITIHAIHANNLRKTSEDTSPFLKVHFGNMILRSASALNGGKNPVWGDRGHVTFPLQGVDLKHSNIRIAVVKKDFVRKGVGECDLELGYVMIDSNMVRQWIASGGFTGEMEVLDQHSKDEDSSLKEMDGSIASGETESKRSKWMSFRDSTSSSLTKRTTILLRVKVHFPSLLMPEADVLDANKPDMLRGSGDGNSNVPQSLYANTKESMKEIELALSSSRLPGDESPKDSTHPDIAKMIGRGNLFSLAQVAQAKIKPRLFQTNSKNETSPGSEEVEGEGQGERRAGLRDGDRDAMPAAAAPKSPLGNRDSDSDSNGDDDDCEDDDAYMITGTSRRYESNEEVLFNELDKKRIFSFARKGAAEGSEEMAALVALDGQISGLVEDVKLTKNSLESVIHEKEKVTSKLQKLQQKFNAMMIKHNITDFSDDEDANSTPRTANLGHYGIGFDHGDHHDLYHYRRNPLQRSPEGTERPSNWTEQSYLTAHESRKNSRPNSLRKHTPVGAPPAAAPPPLGVAYNRPSHSNSVGSPTEILKAEKMARGVIGVTGALFDEVDQQDDTWKRKPSLTPPPKKEQADSKIAYYEDKSGEISPDGRFHRRESQS